MPTPNFNFPTINQNDTANVPRDLNALATSLDTAFQQTEYQTATVVGAQIRVTKPSASSRVFFRLTNTINGGTPITISTDGGATSVNLVDNDGANITTLEKGFIEVVKVGSFFIFRSKGASPSDLATLASVIGAPAVATDSLSTQTSKLRDAKDTLAANLVTQGVPSTSSESVIDLSSKVLDIVTGIPTTGTKTSNSGSMVYDLYNTGSFASNTLEVSGIGFVPSKLIITYTSGNDFRKVEYYKQLGSLTDVVFISSYNFGRLASAESFMFKGNSGNAFVNATGFRLPVQGQNLSFSWAAYK